MALESAARAAAGRALLETVDEPQEKGLEALRSLGVIDYSTGQLTAAIDKLTTARAGLATVFGESHPNEQSAAYWLAAALAAAGRVDEAADLAARLQADALRIALGGGHWETRLDVLHARIMIGQGRAGQGRGRRGVAGDRPATVAGRSNAGLVHRADAAGRATGTMISRALIPG